MQKKSRYGSARRALMFWTAFVGIGAVAGSVGMFVRPDGSAIGMDKMLVYFQVLPFADMLFKNYVFSGIALLIVNGITNLTAFILLAKRKRSGAILGGIFGITLMLWICIQFYMFPPNFMSSAYFVFGMCQAITGYTACVFEKQESFRFDERDYKNIGTNPKELVVYFSRMGYVKKKAYERADETGARLYEIKATERTSGTTGFWWCGRYGMHRWEMPIEPVKEDLTAYEHITVCAPIWVFSLASPVRAFLAESSGKIKSVGYILVHHTNGDYENIADEADKILGIKRTGFESIRCREGRYKTIRGKDYVEN